MTEPVPRPSGSERPIWGEHLAPEPASGADSFAGGGVIGGGTGDGFTGTFVGDGYAGTAVFGFARSGPPDSQAALRQYLIVRALGRSAVNTLQWSALAILALAVLCWLSGVKVLAVFIGLVAVAVLLVRSLLSALGRRLSGANRLGPVEPQVRRLVARTGRGLRRELRRVGLPGVPWAPLLIALRLIRPYRRQKTAQSLARIELNRVVPASQLDELHLLLQSADRLR